MTLRLARLADDDRLNIARWTVRRFGATQARAYARLIDQALARIEADPVLPASRPRQELGPGLRALHLAALTPRRSMARHVIYYRPASDGVIVLRILHDAMDVGAAPGLADQP